MHNVAIHNTRQHNEAAPSVALGVQHPQVAYRYEARTDAGLLVALLGKVSEGKWLSAVNEYGDLEFEYPYDSTSYAYFDYSNQIWLRGDRGQLLEKFHVTERKRVHTESGALVVSVKCRSLMYQLSREIVTNYETGNEQQTITITATGGTYTLTFRGQTTSSLNYNANAGTIQTALQALSTIGASNATVTGTGPFVVEFAGDLAETDVPKLLPNNASMTGGSLSVATTRATKTVREIVQKLLSTYQVHARPIILGSIDVAIGSQTKSVRIEGKSIMAALRELQQLYGGSIWVDPNTRRLYWKRVQGSRTGQYVRIGFNGQNIEETEDFTGIATRVIAVGRGDSYESALRVTVNDSAAQSAYGIIPHLAVNKDINDLTVLTDWADALLDSLKVPRKTYNVGVIDLARLTANDYSFHDLSVGNQLRVMDTQFAITLDTRIVTIERDLDHPLNVQIQVANPSAGTISGDLTTIPRDRTIEDTIADLLEAIERQQRDTGFDDALAEQIARAIADNIENITNIVGELLALPGDNIQQIGDASAAGSSERFAREDHVHDAFGAATPEVVGRSGATGASTLAARIDHVHPGLKATIVTNYSDLAGLSSPGAGDMAAPTAVNMLYGYINGAWQAVGVWVASGYGSLPTTGVLDGDLGYVTDKDRFYQRSNSAWKILGTFVDTSAPSSVGETNGDAWYDSTNHFYYVRINGTWTRVPYLYSATDKASLASAVDGSLGYTTGSNKYGYFRVNSGWKGITHFE